MVEPSTLLCDTGPLVALFNPGDARHAECRTLAAAIPPPWITTISVLTEVVWLLGPGSRAVERLHRVVGERGVLVWHFDFPALLRAFELMEQYADQSMDLPDASLIVAAEQLDTTRVFTLDRRDFAVYRVRRGHRHLPLELV